MTQDLIDFTLHLADNALILGHRNSEWCGHGPVLEQDIAITNISLDLVGPARNFYQYAATLINETGVQNKATEDSLAYMRGNQEYKNCLLAEQPNGDWAKTILRQFLFSAYQFYLYQQLSKSIDAQLAAIAEKSLKEIIYHLRWSSEWIVRLGDGTEVSHNRMRGAIDELWMFTEELFIPAPYERQVIEEKKAVAINLLKPTWEQKVAEIFKEAGLPYPGARGQQTGGKEGRHTEHLGYILDDMQFLQRTYPENSW